MRRNQRYLPYVLIGLVSFLVGGLVVSTTVRQYPLQAQSSDDDRAVATVTQPYAIADIAERVTPAVVLITTEFPATRQNQDPFDDPFFRSFFGPWFTFPDSQQPRVGWGTGFIIDEEGHILTNQHVVGNRGQGQKITVRINTGKVQKEVPAKLLGSDYALDLAVLQIDKPRELAELPTVKLGNSDKVRPGEWVIAIGNPSGLEHTVTVGVLSAKGREIRIPDPESRRVRTYRNLMQTDAAINPGNSGGPLLNIRGEVIGINTAVRTDAQGIGFAIPINVALKVKDELIRRGRVVVGWIGIQTYPVDERVQEALGLREARGRVITDVFRGSPAEKAGLRVYDVILRIDNTDLKDDDDFQKALAGLKPGDKHTFLIERNGRRFPIAVIAGEAPEGFESSLTAAP